MSQFQFPSQEFVWLPPCKKFGLLGYMGTKRGSCVFSTQRLQSRPPWGCVCVHIIFIKTKIRERHLEGCLPAVGLAGRAWGLAGPTALVWVGETEALPPCSCHGPCTEPGPGLCCFCLEGVTRTSTSARPTPACTAAGVTTC